MRLLLIEDYAGISTAAKCVLEAEGHRVVIAETGEEALSLLQNHSFDLILLDLNTNGIPASLFVNKFQDLVFEAALSKPLLGLFSADSKIETKAKNLDADFFIPKPFEPEVLCAKISSLEQRQAPPTASAPAPQAL